MIHVILRVVFQHGLDVVKHGIESFGSISILGGRIDLSLFNRRGLLLLRLRALHFRLLNRLVFLRHCYLQIMHMPMLAGRGQWIPPVKSPAGLPCQDRDLNDWSPWLPYLIKTRGEA